MHSSLHFAIGAWIGILALLPRTIRAIKLNAKSSGPTGLLIIVSYTLGTIAIIPNLLRQMGFPNEICASPLMNIFLLNPLFDKLIVGGMLKGELAVISVFLIQYALLLLAIKQNIKSHEIN